MNSHHLVMVEHIQVGLVQHMAIVNTVGILHIVGSRQGVVDKLVVELGILILAGNIEGEQFEFVEGVG